MFPLDTLVPQIQNPTALPLHIIVSLPLFVSLRIFQNRVGKMLVSYCSSDEIP